MLPVKHLKKASYIKEQDSLSKRLEDLKDELQLIVPTMENCHNDANVMLEELTRRIGQLTEAIDDIKEAT